MSTSETMQLVAPHLDIEAETARMDASEEMETDGLVKIDGAAELVHSLPQGSWAVATSGTQAMARTRLGYAGVPIPAVFITIEDVERGKPEPEPYLLAAERLGVAPGQCVVIEDAPAGIKAAHAAGMRVIAVATTHATEELEEADVVAAQLTDIEVAKSSDESLCLKVYHV